MIHVDPPFDLGESLKGTQTYVDELGAAQTKIINKHWEGAVFEFPDVDRSPSVRGGKSRRSGGTIKAVCVRNISGGQLVVKSQLCAFATSWSGGGEANVFGSVAALATDINVFCGVGDPEWHGKSTGVEDNDLFWVVIGGRVKVEVKASENIAVGDLLASSANDGEAQEFVTTADTSTDDETGAIINLAVANAQNVIGRALEADSNVTNGDLLWAQINVKY